MNELHKYIESGILEMYVLGVAMPEEEKEVEKMAASHPEVLQEIESIRNSLEELAILNARTPCVTVKPFLFASIDYQERMKKGEKESFPPMINEKTTLAEFSTWLLRDDMVLPSSFEDYYAKIIGYTPAAITAIVWINESAPTEVHHDEVERFLIAEGSCDITIGNVAHSLIPGDYMSMPLHVGHKVKVTSDIPCKVILQRAKVLV